MRFSELHFGHTEQCPHGGLQAVGVTADGHPFSVTQIPYDIWGAPNITYCLCWLGRDDLDVERWLFPFEVEAAIAAGPGLPSPCACQAEELS